MNTTQAAAAPKPVVTANPVSTFDQVKGTALKAVNWLGRQIQWLKNTVVSWVTNVIQAIKPYLARVAKVGVDGYQRVRDYIMANKEVAIPVTVTAVFATVATLAAYFLCCDNKDAAEGGKTTTATPGK
jgi:hypothetical protein